MTDVPPGKLAAVVTTLEMRRRADQRAGEPDFSGLVRHMAMPPDAYRAFYRDVGQEWLWFSRLAMDDATLTAIIHDPAVEVWILTAEGRPAGLLELDFRVAGECELAFFGVMPFLIGTGTGRSLMNQAIAQAWAKPIKRFWLHTCTLDHPAAVSFYQRSGFVAVRRAIEVADDPRLNGLLPKGVAPHVPIIPGAANGW